MFSVTLAPLNTQRVGAGLALDGVAAVARVPDERVVAGAEQGHVVAAAAGDGVVAVAADQRVVALAADDGVVAGAAVDGEPMTPAGKADALIVSLPPPALTISESLAPSAPLIVTGAGSPVTVTAAPAPAT